VAAASPHTDRRQQITADTSLILVTLIWGSTFVLVKDLIREVPPLLFLAMRFALGAVTLALVMLAMRRWRGLSRTELIWGGVLGLALYAGYVFQTVGLQWTTASNAGFITGLSVVLVPLLTIPVLRQVPSVWAWLGVALATVGLALLSLQVSDRGDLHFSLNSGDAFVLVCAFAFALHILLVARVAPRTDPLRLAFVQVLVCGLLSVFTSMLLEKPVSSLSIDVWAGTLFMGVAATALTITIQVSMQRFTSAVHTVLIFSLEPVFAAIFGVWLHGDRLQAIAWTGAALILAGMLVAELGGYLAKRAGAKSIIPL
jgi:drug/metabolite transporter (DMT)-like permease